MSEHPRRVLRRLTPDPVQLQVILGSLLGDASLEGIPGTRRMRVTHGIDRFAYARWKYDRLGAFADEPVWHGEAAVGFRTIAHPLFDDLAPLFYRGARCRGTKRVRRQIVLQHLTPLGLAVWMADLGRLELRTDAFLPAQRAAALAP